MGRKKITIDQLASEVDKILQEYGEDVDKNLRDIVKETVKKGAAAVRNSAGGAVGGTGKYARSWTSEVGGGRLRVEGTVYSKKPGLPHLLEHGHALRGGGRSSTAARPHIAPVEEELVREFESKVISRL